MLTRAGDWRHHHTGHHTPMAGDLKQEQLFRHHELYISQYHCLMLRRGDCGVM